MSQDLLGRLEAAVAHHEAELVRTRTAIEVIRGLITGATPAPVKRETPREPGARASRPAREPGKAPLPERLLAAVSRGITNRKALAAELDMPMTVLCATITRLRLRGLLQVSGAKGSQTISLASPATPPAEPEPAPPPVTPVPTPRVVPPPVIVEPDVSRRVVDVIGITSRHDRFRCLPLKCTLQVDDCLKRQDLANEWSKARSRVGIEARQRANAFAACAACKLGKEVRERVAFSDKARVA